MIVLKMQLLWEKKGRKSKQFNYVCKILDAKEKKQVDTLKTSTGLVWKLNPLYELDPDIFQ